jgi:hypothetical protein
MPATHNINQGRQMPAFRLKSNELSVNKTAANEAKQWQIELLVARPNWTQRHG